MNIRKSKPLSGIATLAISVIGFLCSACSSTDSCGFHTNDVLGWIHANVILGCDGSEQCNGGTLGSRAETRTLCLCNDADHALHYYQMSINLRTCEGADLCCWDTSLVISSPGDLCSSPSQPPM
jgi:hypothetical protein